MLNEKIIKITPDDGYHYFFGYYDLQPNDKTGKLHLAHRVKFADRLPEKEDICEVGVIDIAARRFIKIGETTAWNFQQGAFLNWFGENSIIFNAFTDGKLCSMVKDLDGNTVKVLPMPIASLSQDKKWGLSINFARVYAFRPGYGYVGTKDKYANEKAPEKDGVFLVDVQSGKCKLLISYAELVKKFPEPPYTEDKLVINHVTFNPSGDKFLMLLRNFPEHGKKSTQVLVIDVDGNVKKMTDYQVNSHYSWKNDQEFIVWSVLEEGKGIYFFDAKTGKRSRLNEDILDKDDIHCLYSPDGDCFIGDSYPYVDGYRHIYKYNFQDGSVEDLIKVKHDEPRIGDIRCDLHARFSRDGKELSFDSYCGEYRAIYRLRLEE